MNIGDITKIRSIRRENGKSIESFTTMTNLCVAMFEQFEGSKLVMLTSRLPGGISLKGRKTSSADFYFLVNGEDNGPEAFKPFENGPILESKYLKLIKTPSLLVRRKEYVDDLEMRDNEQELRKCWREYCSSLNLKKKSIN